MKKNQLLKILVPIVAMVVLFESVMLISRLGKNNKVVTGGSKPVVTKPVENVYNLEISGNKQMKFGVSGDVEVKMTGKSPRNLDAISLYVKYDTAAFDVSGLVYDKKLGTPSFAKVSTTKGMVVLNFLFANATGLTLNSGEVISLVKFNVKPKAVGDYNFEISSGNGTKESATMIVENATTKVLPYSSNVLNVKVTK